MVGVTPDGRLRIETDDGERRIPQSELKAILRDLPPPETPVEEPRDSRKVDPVPASDGSLDSNRRFRASMLIPGLYQIQHDRPLRGSAILVSLIVFSASTAALYAELNANARAASSSFTYQLYLDQSFDRRHRELATAFQASQVLSAAVVGVHVVDVLWFAPPPVTDRSNIPGELGQFGISLRFPLDW
jgi:hypothetical protein